MLSVYCAVNGLTWLPDAISVVWPQAVVQLCVVHLIRASLRYASRKYWAPLSRDLRPVYTAADEASAAAALEARRGSGNTNTRRSCWLWRVHLVWFTPFLAFPPEVRRVIYMHEPDRVDECPAAGSHPQPGPVPPDQAALKVLYLAVRNLEEFRGPNTGIRSSGVETGAPGVHDLLRRANPNTMTATITYTDGRTLP